MLEFHLDCLFKVFTIIDNFPSLVVLLPTEEGPTREIFFMLSQSMFQNTLCVLLEIAVLFEGLKSQILQELDP
jgi:hypothetical protein